MPMPRILLLSFLSLITCTSATLCAHAEDDRGVFADIEIGYGSVFSKLSGRVPFSLLGQPFEVKDSNMLGAGGGIQSVALWAGLKKHPEWQLGFVYSSQDQTIKVDGEALDGVASLTDPTFLEFNTYVSRKNYAVHAAWSPKGLAMLQPRLGFGLGKGQWNIRSKARVHSTFLKGLTQEEFTQSSVSNINFSLGVKWPLSSNLYFGVESTIQHDFSPQWSNTKTKNNQFIFSLGYRFGARLRQEPRKKSHGIKGKGHQVEGGTEFTQGSYNVKWSIDTINRLGVQQTLDFNTKNMFNGSATLNHISYWRPLNFLCNLDGNEMDVCPILGSAQYINQIGTGNFQATVLEEGPLVNRDHELDVHGRIAVEGGFLNLAYAPAHSSTLRPYLGMGVGYIALDVKLENLHPNKDVFDEAISSKSLFAYQVFVGVDYKISKRVDIGLTSRFMFKQMSWGLSLKYRL